MTLSKIKKISKPFWIPLIACVYLSNTQSVSIAVIFALIFGYIGDLLLMLPKKKFFIAGAFSFMIGHFFYIFTFLRDAGGLSVFLDNTFLCAIALIPYLLFLIFMNKLLGKNLSSILVPAICYLSVLMLMSYCSFLRFFNISTIKASLTFGGSLLFIVSDSFIAIRNFKKRFRGIEAIVVITYITAQLLIVIGLV